MITPIIKYFIIDYIMIEKIKNLVYLFIYKIIDLSDIENLYLNLKNYCFEKFKVMYYQCLIKLHYVFFLYKF